MAKSKKNDADLYLTNQICFSIYTASRSVVQAYQPYLNQYDLTYAQYLVMLTLWEHDGLSVSQIGTMLDMDSGMLSPIIKKLEAKLLVKKERQTKDERMVLIRLTPKGRKTKENLFAVREQLICESGFELKDLGQLKTQLELLTKNLSEAMSKKSKKK